MRTFCFYACKVLFVVCETEPCNFYYCEINTSLFFPDTDPHVFGDFTMSPYGGCGVNWLIPGHLIHWDPLTVTLTIPDRLTLTLSTNTGVPQRSVLKPVHFLLISHACLLSSVYNLRLGKINKDVLPSLSQRLFHLPSRIPWSRYSLLQNKGSII